MATRNPADLTPSALEKFKAFSNEMDKRNVPFILTNVLRTQVEQAALYVQSRAPLDTVNTLRKFAGLPPIDAQRNKRPVTWTLHSRHLEITKADVASGRASAGGIGKSRAFDIVIMRGRTAEWDIKADIDHDEVPDYEEAAAAGRAVGLICGADFRDKHGNPRPDWCHFESPMEE